MQEHILVYYDEKREGGGSVKTFPNMYCYENS